ncbi:MAG: hypothetical protein ACO3A8_10980 [Steroidobacteraceae bacterium]|jgi:hypothetical protein|nr:hypothetical protein [Gammaproteobacteria bacterium]
MSDVVDILRRPLVLALVLANVTYFLWSAFVAPNPPGTVPWRLPGARDAVGARLPQGVENIVLAGEAARAVAARVEEVVTTCFGVGPFDSQAASAAAALYLRARDYAPEVFYPSSVQPVQTAVVIDDLPTRADQQRVLRRLRDAGWRDVAALEPRRDAPDALGAVYPISLGVFVAAEGARARADAAVRAGLAPVLRPRYAADAEHWLRVRSSGAAATALEARRIAAGRGWRVVACDVG